MFKNSTSFKENCNFGAIYKQSASLDTDVAILIMKNVCAYKLQMLT